MRIKQFRNVYFPKRVWDLNKAARQFEDAQVTAEEQPTGWILKRRIMRFKQLNNGILDEIMFSARSVYKTYQTSERVPVQAPRV